MKKTGNHIDENKFLYNELLKDKLFLQAFLYPSEEGKKYIEQLEQDGMQEEIKYASQLLISLSYKDKNISSEQEELLIRRIYNSLESQKRRRFQRRSLLIAVSAAAGLALLFLFQLNDKTSVETDNLTKTAEMLKPKEIGPQIQLIINESI